VAARVLRSATMRLDRSAFEELVAETLDSLPERIAAQLANVAVVVEDWPSREQRREAGLGPGEELLGLYEGTPLTARDAGYDLVAPDRITIFRRPLLAASATRGELEEEVRRTVLHELAHHFGIDDDRLEALGAY